MQPIAHIATFHYLLELRVGDAPPIRINHGTAPVTSRGEVFEALPFDLLIDDAREPLVRFQGVYRKLIAAVTDGRPTSAQLAVVAAGSPDDVLLQTQARLV